MHHWVQGIGECNQKSLSGFNQYTFDEVTFYNFFRNRDKRLQSGKMIKVLLKLLFCTLCRVAYGQPRTQLINEWSFRYPH